MASTPIEPGALAASLTGAGLDLFVQSVLLTGFGLIGARALRRLRNAPLESLALRATLLAVLACPLVSMLLGAADLRWGVDDAGLVARTRQTVENLFPAQPPVIVTDRPLAPPMPAANTATAVAISRSAPLSPRLDLWLAAAWLVVMAIMLARLMLAHGHLARVRRRAVAAPQVCLEVGNELAEQLGVKRADIRVTPRVQGPCLVGLWRPSILLPPEDVRDQQNLRLILIHEFAHQIRHDTVWNFLCRFTRAFLCFNPLVWRLTRLLEESGDEVADNFVVAFGRDTKTYAARLLEYADRPLGRFERAAGAGVVAFKSALGRRVQRVLEEAGARAIHSARRHKVWSAVIAGCALIVTGIFSITSAQAGAESGGKVTVDGLPSQYDSIQAAIDAAPPGCVVRIGPGHFPERIKVTKTLTLVGEGWDKTSVGKGSNPSAALEKLKAQYEAASSDDERKKLSDMADQVLGAELSAIRTLVVEGARGIVLRGIKFTSPGQPMKNGRIGASAVELKDAQVKMEQCAVIASLGGGIAITGASDVAIDQTLVAGVWSTGIAVGGKEAPNPVLRLTNSEVRNCYYAGVQIGGSAEAAIDRCRVSGSAWHGIRYDNASPTISGSLVHHNARFGIYASGKTAATVTGNVFFKNEMAGVGCWFLNADRIEQNTFDANHRSGIEVLGESNPLIRKNIFLNHPTAVMLGPIGGDKPHSKTTGKVQLEQNVFWQNGRNAEVVQEGGAKLDYPLPADNLIEDPQVSQANQWRPKPESTAAKLGIGAQEPLAFESPWPLQPEEIAIIPDGDTRDSKAWKRAPLEQAE